jgi:multiple sugar transport system permease protein
VPARRVPGDAGAEGRAVTSSVGSTTGTAGTGELAGTLEATAAPPPRRRRGRGSALRRQERWAGWLFVLPGLAVLIVFLVVPIGLAFYVSLTRWDGLSSPFGGGARFIGFDNYKSLLTVDNLTRQNFATSIRNNVYFVLFVVPLQTGLALFLAVLLNNKFLRGRSHFRTAFFFPSVTSSIATTLVFLFLFSGGGAVNQILPIVVDAAGIFLMRQFFVNIPTTMEEAARIDGAGVFRTDWSVILPMARPGLITLMILSFQGSWNEFQLFLVSTSDPKYNTLTTGLAKFSSGQLGSGTQYPLTLGAALLSTIPVAIVFFAFQRHFIGGQLAAAVKG